MLQFSDIEARRVLARIEQKELCRRAGVHHMTYSRLKNRPGKAGASERTLIRLKTALDAIVASRAAALDDIRSETHA